MGNLRSVEKALEHVGVSARITADPDRGARREGVILPGVGAFPRRWEGSASWTRRADPRAPGWGLRSSGSASACSSSSTDRGARRRERTWPLAGRGNGLDARPQGAPHRLVAGPLGARLAADRRYRVRDAVLFRPLLRRASRRRRAAGHRRLRRPFRLPQQSTTTSSASSSIPRSRAPPDCGCSPTSPGSVRSRRA